MGKNVPEKYKILVVDFLSENHDKIIPLIKDKITSILNYKSQKWVDVVSKEIQEKTKETLNLIKSERPNLGYSVQKTLDSLEKLKFIYDENGCWSYLNKLNTNLKDSSRFIGELLYHSNKYDIVKIYNQIKKGDYSDFKLFLDELPKHSKFIWDNILINEEKYTSNILINSSEGEKIENLIESYYRDNGWNIYFRGGNGNIIDMLFSIDLIVEKGGEYKFIQVKKSPSIKIVKINDKIFTSIGGNILPKNVTPIDTIAYATLNGDIVIVDRQEYYFYGLSGELKKESGLPMPSRINKYEILIPH